MNKDTKQCDIGMVGLGVMGRNLLLNMIDHGFTVAGYDIDTAKVASLKQESNAKAISEETLEKFVQQLKKPRAIMLLVPAGDAVDAAIHGLLPYLEAGDLIIDGGNSHFTDTDQRIQRLQSQGIDFLGVGISGGEEGARRGPSIMPGGEKKAYERVKDIFTAVAAKVNGDPCVAYLGKGSAGHYVKMVHNGIEYGIMQLIAETYAVLKQGLQFSNQALAKTYAAWNDTELNSYLLEITARIFKQQDDRTQNDLIDMIVGIAEQNGTGVWTSESAMKLQIPTPIIDTAVYMRDLSMQVAEREQASALYALPVPLLSPSLLEHLPHAFYMASILTYAQGMALLAKASQQYHYDLHLESVARIWRGGCIIRSKFLNNIMDAFRAHNDLNNLLLDPSIAHIVKERQTSLRELIRQVAPSGLAMPAFLSALGYFDALCSQWTPANLIQSQRDYFGSHRYQRIDAKGMFHTQWNEDK